MIIILNAEIDRKNSSQEKTFEELNIYDFHITREMIYRSHKILLFENSDTENCKAKFLKIYNNNDKILTETFWENVSLTGNKTGILNYNTKHVLAS